MEIIVVFLIYLLIAETLDSKYISCGLVDIVCGIRLAINVFTCPCMGSCIICVSDALIYYELPAHMRLIKKPRFHCGMNESAAINKAINLPSKIYMMRYYALRHTCSEQRLNKKGAKSANNLYSVIINCWGDV